MFRTQCEQAWNAALEATGDEGFHHLKTPSSVFDEWYKREVANPPEGWDDHRDD